MQFKLILLALAGFVLASCNSSKTMSKSVVEVTQFKLKSTANASAFNELDAQVEANFTGKQPGFVRRQSAVNEQGEYAVLVYWNTLEDAEASMQKFMADESVADYASMIDGSTMKMDRYTSRDEFQAANSEFVEVMSFQTQEGTDLKVFNQVNQKVETGFTGKQDGFLERITGANEAGKQVVAVYWDSKSKSDAALEPFMANPISQEFMGMMEQPSIQMGRYQMLTSLSNQEMTFSNKDKVVALLNSFNTG
ncbi:MAG: hypothetical protein AAF804_13095, partial [Bacteroidota bacterium]